MPNNNRIWWAVRALGLAPYGSTAYVATKGVQSCGINTNFNLEQVFELGQSALYANLENIPDVELTAQKVLDGQPLLYHLATRGRATTTLAGRGNQRCNAALSLFSDNQDSASGQQVAEIFCSGMYVSSLTYTFPVEGNCTEDITLVGNNKVYRTGGFTFTGGYLNTDAPIGTSGIQRRQNVVFACNSGVLDVNGSVASTNSTILPQDIPGISTSGTNNVDVNGNYPCALQGITISADLGRNAIYELGHKAPYFRYINYPVEVSCEITVISKSGDNVSATDTGILSGSNAGNNLANRSIRVYTQDGTFINLGTVNKLNSVSIGDGDTGGGNETLTYRYTTFNTLDVQNTATDPG